MKAALTLLLLGGMAMADELRKHEGVEPIYIQGPSEQTICTQVRTGGSTCVMDVYAYPSKKHIGTSGLTVQPIQFKEAFVIRPDGTIWWKDHEVETDAQLREAILQFVYYVQHGTFEGYSNDKRD